MTATTIHDQLRHIDALRNEFRKPDLGADHRADIAAELTDLYAALLSKLDLVAYPVEADTDDRLEQIVLTLHGVEISVRGRTHDREAEPGEPTGDILVHIEDHRDDNDRRTYPLALDVNETGEHQYT